MNKAINTGLAEERFWRIREFLRENGAASVEDLCDELNVSAATVRRDLTELSAKAQIKRVHGGAVSIETRLGEPVFDDKARIMEKEKAQIARDAYELISPNDCIYLDGGSTVLLLAGLLIGMNKLTVVTNSLRVAQRLSTNGPRMILIGGEFRRISQTFVGSLTRTMIDQITVDKAFMGTVGMKDGELTTTDPSEALTKELILQGAKSSFIMADSTKFNVSSFVQFGKLSSGMTLITDIGITDEQENLVKECNVNVIK